MWKFWWTIIRRVPYLAWNSVFHFEAVFAAVLFVIWIYDVTAGEKTMTWFGTHPAVILTAIGLIFLHLIMKAVYEEYDNLKKKNAEENESLKREITRLSNEFQRLKQKYLQLIVDHDPKTLDCFHPKLRAIVKTNSLSRTVHNISLKLIEFCQIPGSVAIIGDPLPFALDEDGNCVIDLHAGGDIRVPIVEFGDNESIRVLGEGLQWYGNRKGVFYRITVLATGQNATPAKATFIVGFGRKGAFFNRLATDSSTSPPAADTAPSASDSPHAP